MRCALIVVILAAMLAMSSAYSDKALNDEIIDLPDAPEVKFRQFAGYIDIMRGTRSLFYWFVEARDVDPATAPIVLWTNGGPGCSGLLGKFTENGPYVPQADGTLSLRQYSWNSKANIIFFEQPAGVGFSRVSSSVQWTDANTASNNHEFLEEFFKVYPEYSKNDLYLASESYGGHYLPTLALDIVKNPTVNLKGLIVGNPLIYMPYRDFGSYATYGQHSRLPLPEFTKYQKLCTPDVTKPQSNPAPARPSLCDTLERQFNSVTRGMDPYALDFPTCIASNGALRTTGSGPQGEQFKKYIAQAHGENPANLDHGIVPDYFADHYEPCSDDYAFKYLNRGDVQKAIHARPPNSGPVRWGSCSNVRYSSYDMNTSMMPVYKELIKRTDGSLRITIFSGDDDTMCSTTEAQMALFNSGLTVKSYWKPWTTSNGQQAGYLTKFDGLNFVTVSGAGHMVPSTKPRQAYEMFNNFLLGKM